MCGILGCIGPEALDAASCARALDLMTHRGPDARGERTFRGETLYFGHRRLKIIDLSDDANQPMTSACGRYHIIFNGEIFNFRELRSELSAYPYRTNGDTEVLLAAWTEFGPAMLDRLNGMFALAIYDEPANKIFIARDRFGIKPLYYRVEDGRLAFASEIPPLLQFGSPPRPDLRTIRTYLSTGVYDNGEHTFFEGIRRLEAGSSMEIDTATREFSLSRWYDLPSRLHDFSGRSEESLLEELDHLLEAAVKRHFIADVPVGVNISGGLDSSTLLHFADRLVPGVHGFTQDYEGYSERPWVEKVVAGTRVEPHYLELGAEQCLDLFEPVLHHQAEPIGGIPVIGFHALYELADQLGVTVLLDGNGVDEILLGYKKYHYRYLASQAGSGPRSIDDFSAFWGEDPATALATLEAMQRQPGAGIDGTIAIKSGALGPALAGIANYETRFDHSTGDEVRDMGLEDLFVSKIPRALRFNDRISMMLSKELRVPFLDPTLVEWAVSVPLNHLINKTGTKAVLRKLMARHIPPDLAYARKRMVQTPQREWLGDQWRPLVEEILESKSFASRGWVDPAAAKNLYRRYLEGDNANSFYIWQWLNLELWARRFLDSNST